MNNDDDLADAFGVQPFRKAKAEDFEPEDNDIKALPPPRIIDNIPDANTTLVKARDDYDFARQNLRDLITLGMKVANEVAEVASQTQSPNTYTSAAQIFKSVADTNKELMDLSRKHQDIELKGGHVEKTQVQNNLFVGTTADLAKILGMTRKKKDLNEDGE